MGSSRNMGTVVPASEMEPHPARKPSLGEKPSLASNVGNVAEGSVFHRYWSRWSMVRRTSAALTGVVAVLFLQSTPYRQNRLVKETDATLPG